MSKEFADFRHMKMITFRKEAAAILVFVKVQLANHNSKDLQNLERLGATLSPLWLAIKEMNALRSGFPPSQD